MNDSFNQVIGSEQTGNASGFFIIDLRTWQAICDLGMHEAVAYLVIARGTLSDNRTSRWSKKAIQTYTGLAFSRAQAAIKRLCDTGFIRQTRAGTKPQYMLSGWAEIEEKLRERQPKNLSDWDTHVLERVKQGNWPKRVSTDFRESVNRLRRIGLLPRDPNDSIASSEVEPKQADNLIWLPNTLVSGTSEGEDSPLRRVRRCGDVWTLRLLVELYHAHNLRDDGGIERRFLRKKYERRKVGERGIYTVWGFQPGAASINLNGILASHEQRPRRQDQDHPIWVDIDRLRQQGLIAFVPHLCESEAYDAEIIHPYGTDHRFKKGTLENAEYELGQAAHAAGEAMGLDFNVEKAVNDDCCLAPVPSRDYPNVQMVGIARLTYRPHTIKTRAWWAEHSDKAPIWARRYTELRVNAEATSVLTDSRLRTACPF
jgi:hypothetical protein